MPSPVLWGDEATVRSRLSEGTTDIRMTPCMYHFDCPFPPDQVVEFFRTNYGPMARAFSSLDANGQLELRAELVRLWSDHSRNGRDSTHVEAEWKQSTWR